MRKFVFSIISLVNMILVGIAYGLGSNTAMWIGKPETHPSGNWYQLVFNAGSKGYSVANIIGFALLVFATLLTVIALVPFKGRKVVNLLAGGSYIAAGVLVLWTPTNYMIQSGVEHAQKFFSSGSLIGMAVLLFVAGGFALLGAIIELGQKKQA